MNEKSLYRIGGLAAIGSGIITQVSGALHPVETETIFQPAVHMKEVAENASWSFVYSGFTVGFVLMVIGLTAIARSLRDDKASGWASVARSMATVSTAVALVFFAIDGFAIKLIAVSVQGAGNTEAMLAAAGAVDRIGRAFFGQWTLLAWGITPLLFGVTVLMSASYQKWLGVLPVLSGVLGVSAGLMMNFSDFTLGLLPPFYGAVALFNLFQIAMGVVMVRRSLQASTQGLPAAGRVALQG